MIPCIGPEALSISDTSEAQQQMGTPISRQHVWVGATHVPLNERQAKYAANRGSVRVAEDLKLDILEVYCIQCKQVMEDAPSGCAAAVSTEHLRGGPIGIRQSRKHPWHDCDLYDCYEALPKGFGRGAVAPPQSDERHRRRAVSA